MSDRVHRLERARRRPHAGSKAHALAHLRALGFAVPDGFVIPPSLLSHGTDEAHLSRVIAGFIDADGTYAVRSSADVEDGARRSYAGRFTTLLDVPGIRVAHAALEVAAGEPAAVYDDTTSRDGNSRVAVIVQRMIQPHVAGVVFSRNPVTGVKETVLEATRGTAADLVAGRERPERWVRKRGFWVVRPERPILEPDMADRIADGVEKIERAFGRPIDAEWAWDGTLWWLQARPVTAGSQTAIYSSRMARDMLPGVILPLVWSVNGPLKSRVFLRFLEDVFGPLEVRAEDLGALLHYRFYINIGALSRLFAEFGLPEDSLELLAGMEKGAALPRMPRPTPRAIRRLPRLLASAWRFSHFHRELGAELPGLWSRSRAFAAETDPASLDAPGALARLEDLEALVERTTYSHMVTLMLMQMYSMRVRSRLQKRGLLAKGEPLDLPPPPGSPHDVGAALAHLVEVARTSGEDVISIIRAGDLRDLRAADANSVFLSAFERFLDDFGHLSDSGVNLTSVPWSEQPERVLAVVASMLDAGPRGEGDTKHAANDAFRQAGGRTWRTAERYAAYREETSSLYTYTYGQTRPLALTLGRDLKHAGALSNIDEVFLLTLDEVRRATSGALSASDVRAIVAGRTEEIAAARTGEPPEVVVGEATGLVQIPNRTVLRGIPCSRGQYTGPVTVCGGIGDLERITQGDVVIVPYSDASWTPVFLRAGAIVAESGGLLSHSAILARELGVPAIVSARGALNLVDGTLVSVDGYEGTVTLLATPA